MSFDCVAFDKTFVDETLIFNVYYKTHLSSFEIKVKFVEIKEIITFIHQHLSIFEEKTVIFKARRDLALQPFETSRRG